MRRVGMAVVWVALVLTVSALTWAIAIERWADNWGATDEEVAMTFPGDELIEHPATVTTRAVSVGVPPPQVWPWVAQFGQGRGGLYSYDWLENIFGSGIHSTDRILVEHQDVTVGDQVWITQPGHPADLGHVVAVVDAPHALVTAQSTPQKPAAFEDTPWTWAFVIQSDANNESRVVSRNRYEPQGTMVDLLMDRLVGPVGFAMERRTLLGIAERANRAAGLPIAPAWREPVWFAALLATGAGLVGLLATRTSRARKALFATLITAAATLVLLRFPSAAAAVVLAAVTAGLAVRLHQMGLPARRTPRSPPDGVGPQHPRQRLGASVPHC